MPTYTQNDSSITVDNKHPDVQALTHATVKMCLDTVQNYSDMQVPQRSSFVQNVNRLLETLTSRTSYVIHSHYHENNPNQAGLRTSSSSLAREGDEIVAAQERGGPRTESLRA